MNLNSMTSYHHIYFHVGKNLIFVLIPFLLSLYLFRTSKHRNKAVWIVLFCIFIVFLPNAPYTITDYIHLIADYEHFRSKFIVYTLLLPFYLLFMIFCFECYLICTLLFSRYLKKTIKMNYLFIIEILINAICSFGIFLGRFERLYSWDILFHPLHIMKTIFYSLTHIKTLCILFELFIAITVLYYCFKIVNLIFWNLLKVKMMGIEDGE